MKNSRNSNYDNKTNKSTSGICFFSLNLKQNRFKS